MFSHTCGCISGSRVCLDAMHHEEWNFCIKGKDGAPMSCPTIELVLDYDTALRTRRAKLLNLGFGFQRGLDQVKKTHIK